MTIATRLILLLGIPLAILLGLGAFGHVMLKDIQEKARLAAIVQAESLAVLGHISRGSAEMRVNVRWYLLSTDPAQKSAARAAYDSDKADVARLLDRYADVLITGDKDRRLYTEYRAVLEQWQTAADSVFAASREGREVDAREALARMAGESGKRLSETSREWIGHNEQLADEWGRAVVASIERGRRLALLAGLIAVMLSALLGVIIVRSIVRPVGRLRSSVETMARGDFARAVPFTDNRDEIGQLARSVEVLKQGAAAMDRQRWIKTSAAQVVEAIAGASTIEDFGRRLLETLTPFLGGGVSAFYRLDADARVLRRIAGFGLSATDQGSTFGLGEGLVGQSAQTRTPVTVSDLPPAYLRVDSGVGGAAPTRATAHPLVAADVVAGVFEHASFHAPTAEHAALLETVLPAAALSLEVLSRNIKTRQLLETTQKQQAELSAREEQFRTLLEAAPDALIISDEQGRIVLINAQTENLLGYSRQELVGQSVDILVPERIRARHPGMRRQFHANPSVRAMGSGMELSAVRKDGTEFPVEISLSPLKTNDGRGTLVCSSLRDISERKRMQDNLKAAKEKAEEATKAKSAFLANMSHEIRTPMNGVIGMTELALDTDLTPEQRDYLNTVKSSADALLTIINDILDFSKIEAGRIELDPVDFQLRDSISDTLNPLSLRASTKGVELAYEVEPDVPDAIVGDVHRLRQVLVNLVGNAIKFTSQGEVVVVVSLAERRGDDLGLRFQVKDTGIGIDPAAAARLFQPFEQAEASTTRKYGGTGLGLAISRQLVELMGGSIRLESTPGVGSTFTFTVRMKAGVDRPAIGAEDATRLFAGKTALIVDDNHTNRRILETMLGNWGLQTLSADGGPAALAALDRAASADRPISLIITDLHMPEMDGFELVGAVRGRPATASLPILMLTSSASPGDQARSDALKIAARLIKPVKQSLLLDAILRVLSGARQRETTAAAAPSRAAAPARALRVLLAEDNAVNQKFAVRLLSGAGHQVVVADNGRQAVDKWSSEPFDVVLMDVQMPELDGLDATKEIRGRETGSGRRTPIIAMTANAMAGDRETCLKAGMDGYVAKPVKKELLFAEIGRIVGGVGGAGANGAGTNA